MITCRCLSHGCSRRPGGGKKISAAQAQEHRLADRQCLAAEAAVVAEQAVETQEQDLAACVAAMTLADLTTGQRQSPEIDLTSKFASITLSDGDHSSSVPASNTGDGVSSRLTQEFSHLSKLETSLNLIQAASSAHDTALSTPTLATIFPLSTVLADARTLEASIRNSPASFATVATHRKVLVEKASAVLAKLIAQRTSWDKASRACPAQERIPELPSFNTGEHTHRCFRCF